MRAALSRIVRVIAAVLAGAEEDAEEGGGDTADGEGESVASSAVASEARSGGREAAAAQRAYAAAGGGALRATASVAALLSPGSTADGHAGDGESAGGGADSMLPGAEGALVECVGLVREALGDRLQFNFRRTPHAAAQLLVPLSVLADAAATGVAKRSGAADDAVARLAAALAALEAYARQHASVSVLFNASFAGGGGGGGASAPPVEEGGEEEGEEGDE